MDPWTLLAQSQLVEAENIDHLKKNHCNPETLQVLLELLLPLQKRGFPDWLINGDAKDGLEAIWDSEDQNDIVKIDVHERETFASWPKGTFSIWMGHRHENGPLTSRCRIFNHDQTQEALDSLFELFPPLTNECTECEADKPCPYCSYIKSYIN